MIKLFTIITDKLKHFTLSKKLSIESMNICEFSTTYLWYKVQFYNENHADTNLQPLIGEICWPKYLCKKSVKRCSSF